MTFTKLVLAGSTGYVADSAIRAILASTDPVFDVTILTRANSGKAPLSLPRAKIVKVDYDDNDGLVKAVAGADAILSFLNGLAKAADLKLLKAAQEAGVRRIFPSDSPVVTARKFVALASKDGPTSFTTICPSAFMEGWLAGEFMSIDPKNRIITAVDSGDNFFTGCTMPYLAAAIVAILRMDEEKTKNRRIHVAEIRVTMNQIADAFEDITGARFERRLEKSPELIELRGKYLKEGNSLLALLSVNHMAAFDGSGAGDFTDGLGFNADGFLNVPKGSLRDMVTEAVKKSGIITADA